MELRVILVNEHDEIVGTMEKLQAHELGVLHRAFSILIFNSKGDMLLQKRSEKKYHFKGLWTNACCSHPYENEDVDFTLHQKLNQEMGIDCELSFLFSFTYKAACSSGLTEHELDHVYVGRCDDLPLPNPEEVDAYKWVSLKELNKDLKKSPDQYTPWFKIIMDRLIEENFSINCGSKILS